MPARKLGTWKLAYADFLTALAAFFLLMWLVSGVSQDDRAVIAAEFTGKQRAPAAAAPAEPALATLDLSPVLKAAGDSVRVTASSESITIELVDTAGRPLFETGSGALTEEGRSLVLAAADSLSPLGGAVSIEGHTDAFSVAGSAFSNWDLSTARANEARRALEAAGIPTARIRAVTGYADTRPLTPGQPHLAANRRISLQIQLAD
ncbi:MAG: flagellar motor protein MotB [Hyphomonas sp.]